MTASKIPPVTRALMRALLEHHSVADTHALLACSISGVVVTKKCVGQAAWRIRSEARAAREQDVAPAAASAAPALPAEPARQPKPPLSFEEKLARVAAGAKLVPTFIYRRADPAYSLVGNATALCG